MFLNFKINGKKFLKYLFILMLIVILIIFLTGVYNIFFKKIEKEENNTFTLNDTINSDKIFEISPQNYTSILKTVTENVDNYIGCKVHFTGYIYRLLDFSPIQFVLARDMIVNQNPLQSLVVGFLCEYKNASEFKDGEWVDVTGTIRKSDYYGKIAIIEVTKITTMIIFINTTLDKIVFDVLLYKLSLISFNLTMNG